MFESDADRLGMIKSLGGQLVFAPPDRKFWAVFENAFVTTGFGDVEIEGVSPQLQARTSDVHSLVKDATVRVGDVTYRVKRNEPDGTGMSLLFLKA